MYRALFKSDTGSSRINRWWHRNARRIRTARILELLEPDEILLLLLLSGARRSYPFHGGGPIIERLWNYHEGESWANNNNANLRETTPELRVALVEVSFGRCHPGPRPWLGMPAKDSSDCGILTVDTDKEKNTIATFVQADTQIRWPLMSLFFSTFSNMVDYILFYSCILHDVQFFLTLNKLCFKTLLYLCTQRVFNTSAKLFRFFYYFDHSDKI